MTPLAQDIYRYLLWRNEIQHEWFDATDVFLMMNAKPTSARLADVENSLDELEKSGMVTRRGHDRRIYTANNAQDIVAGGYKDAAYRE